MATLALLKLEYVGRRIVLVHAHAILQILICSNACHCEATLIRHHLERRVEQRATIAPQETTLDAAVRSVHIIVSILIAIFA